MTKKTRLKKLLCIQHRKIKYLNGLQNLIDNTTVEQAQYVSMRWDKYKNVKER